VTFVVQVGLASGAGVDPTYLRLDDPIAGLLDGAQVLAPDSTMTDFGTDSLGRERVMAFTVDRGSTQGAGMLVEYSAGTLSLTLRDDNGDLDPASIPESIPGAAIRLGYVWAGTLSWVFTGTVDSWLPEHRYPDQAVVVVTASDGLATVGGYTRGESAPVGAAEDAGARVNRVLDSIGWPTGQRSIDTGITALTATTLDGNALDELRQVARAEVGDLWATPDGLIRFRNRHGLYLNQPRSTTVQATYGTGGGTEIPFVGELGLSYDRSELVNLVRASRDDPLAVVYEVGDSVSRYRYRDRTQEQLDLPFATDAEVATWADYVLARDAYPKLVYTSLTVDTRVDPDVLYPEVLGREFGDRIAAVRRPPGVAAETRELYIRGIHHSFSAPDVWQTSWELEPAQTGSPFVLDDAARGLLDGTNELIY
jgi:hypothetical protein